MNINREKLRILIFFFFLAFLSFAFGEFVNLFAGGSRSYTVDEGAEDGGECFLVFRRRSHRSELSPQRLFSLTVVRRFLRAVARL